MRKPRSGIRPWFHRDAREWVDSKGETHRRSGPAIEDPSGYKCWMWHGRMVYEHAVSHQAVGMAASSEAANWTWRYFGNEKQPVNDPGQKLFNAPGYGEDKT